MLKTPVKGRPSISAVTGSLSPVRQRTGQKKISLSVPEMKHFFVNKVFHVIPIAASAVINGAATAAFIDNT